MTTTKNHSMHSNNSKGIAFKNFRRFEDFPMLNLGPITYMVGRNNSGKSTMVKALLLVMDYLQNQLSHTFAFDNGVLEDANIVTFGRAKNKLTGEPLISFNYMVNDFDVNIVLSGNDDSTKAIVQKFNVEIKETGIIVNVDYSKDEVSIIRKHMGEFDPNDDRSYIISQLERAIELLEAELEIYDNKNSKEAIRTLTELRKNENKLKVAKRKSKRKVVKSGDIQYELTYPISIFSHLNEDELIFNENKFINLIERFVWLNEIKSSLDSEELFGNKPEYILELSRNNKHLSHFLKKFIESINNQVLYFISANPSKQSALFYLRDKNNPLAQAIHDYYQLVEGEMNNEETRFIKDWMKRFEVGVDFKISMQAGEAYEFKIIEEEGGEKEISLSDKGMGSLQAMTLVLKMASLIRRNEKDHKNITVLVEEPELNLHPALQSKLTDFFYYLNKEYKFNFIIETHSEYMIRKAQLLAMENDHLSNDELDPNPFAIFYFHKKEGPYQMEFTEKGNFTRNFGEGFYDVNDKLAMDLVFKANS